MSDRLSDLRDLRDVLRDSIRDVEPDRRAPLSHQYRATLAEIAELEAAEAPAVTEGSGLLDLTRRLADRKSATTTARKGSS